MGKMLASESVEVQDKRQIETIRASSPRGNRTPQQRSVATTAFERSRWRGGRSA
jgi:hypothetical protein